jgi:hypothetical protein
MLEIFGLSFRENDLNLRRRLAAWTYDTLSRSVFQEVSRLRLNNLQACSRSSSRQVIWPEKRQNAEIFSEILHVFLQKADRLAVLLPSSLQSPSNAVGHHAAGTSRKWCTTRDFAQEQHDIRGSPDLQASMENGQCFGPTSARSGW